MRPALVAAGAAVIALTGAAFAQSTVTIEKKTIVKEVPASGSTVSIEIIAPTPPPPPQVEVPPAPPGPGATWTPGNWRWNPAEQHYTWVPGKFAEPPREHAAWFPGHWRERGDGWVWVEGHWD